MLYQKSDLGLNIDDVYCNKFIVGIYIEINVVFFNDVKKKRIFKIFDFKDQF